MNLYTIILVGPEGDGKTPSRKKIWTTAKRGKETRKYRDVTFFLTTAPPASNREPMQPEISSLCIRFFFFSSLIKTFFSLSLLLFLLPPLSCIDENDAQMTVKNEPPAAAAEAAQPVSYERRRRMQSRQSQAEQERRRRDVFLTDMFLTRNNDCHLLLFLSLALVPHTHTIKSFFFLSFFSLLLLLVLPLL